MMAFTNVDVDVGGGEEVRCRMWVECSLYAHAPAQVEETHGLITKSKESTAASDDFCLSSNAASTRYPVN